MAPQPIGGSVSIGQDIGVTYFVRALKKAQRISPYEWWKERWIAKGRDAGLFAYAYVALLLLMEAAALLSMRWSVVMMLAVAFGAYRYVLLVLWWLLFLFDHEFTRVVRFERNLLLLILNIVELSLVGAVFIAAASGEGRGGAWFDAFSVLTFYNLPGGGFGRSAASVALACSALLLVAGGLSVILSKVATKFGLEQHSEPS